MPKSILTPTAAERIQQIKDAARRNAAQAAQPGGGGLDPAATTRARMLWRHGPKWSGWYNVLETRPAAWGDCLLIDTVYAIGANNELKLASCGYSIPPRLWLDPLQAQSILARTVGLLAKGPVFVVIDYDSRASLCVALHADAASVLAEVR